MDIKGKGKARDYLMEDDEGSTICAEQGTDPDMDHDEQITWKAQAYVTGVNYHVKKLVFLLFINSASILAVND